LWRSLWLAARFQPATSAVSRAGPQHRHSLPPSGGVHRGGAPAPSGSLPCLRLPGIGRLRANAPSRGGRCDHCSAPEAPVTPSSVIRGSLQALLREGTASSTVHRLPEGPVESRRLITDFVSDVVCEVVARGAPKVNVPAEGGRVCEGAASCPVPASPPMDKTMVAIGRSALATAMP